MTTLDFHMTIYHRLSRRLLGAYTTRSSTFTVVVAVLARWKPLRLAAPLDDTSVFQVRALRADDVGTLARVGEAARATVPVWGLCGRQGCMCGCTQTLNPKQRCDGSGSATAQVVGICSSLECQFSA